MANLSAPELSPKAAYEKAWKYVGYRHFSRFLGSHGNFLFARLYRTLNARVLLAMQDYISELEGKLDKLEADLSRQSASDNIHNGSFRLETSKARLDLIWEIQNRLKVYNEYILTYSQLASREAIDTRDIKSVRNWLHSWPNAIRDEELGYLDDKEDLIYVSPKKEGRISRRFKEFLIRKRGWFRRQPAGDTNFLMDHVILHYDERAEEVFTWIIMAIGFAMVIAPLWILEFVPGSVKRLGVMTCFILVFFILLSFMTTARPFESLAATAAYSAVLVVFLQANSG